MIASKIYLPDGKVVVVKFTCLNCLHGHRGSCCSHHEKFLQTTATDNPDDMFFLVRPQGQKKNRCLAYLVLQVVPLLGPFQIDAKNTPRCPITSEFKFRCKADCCKKLGSKDLYVQGFVDLLIRHTEFNMAYVSGFDPIPLTGSVEARAAFRASHMRYFPHIYEGWTFEDMHKRDNARAGSEFITKAICEQWGFDAVAATRKQKGKTVTSFSKAIKGRTHIGSYSVVKDGYTKGSYLSEQSHIGKRMRLENVKLPPRPVRTSDLLAHDCGVVTAKDQQSSSPGIISYEPQAPGEANEDQVENTPILPQVINSNEAFISQDTYTMELVGQAGMGIGSFLHDPIFDHQTVHPESHTFNDSKNQLDLGSLDQFAYCVQGQYVCDLEDSEDVLQNGQPSEPGQPVYDVMEMMDSFQNPNNGMSSNPQIPCESLGEVGAPLLATDEEADDGEKDIPIPDALTRMFKIQSIHDLDRLFGNDLENEDFAQEEFNSWLQSRESESGQSNGGLSYDSTTLDSGDAGNDASHEGDFIRDTVNDDM